MHFGNRMRLHREKRGMTQDELSRRLGVTPQALSHWEVGRCEPSLRKLVRLCVALGTTANELLRDDFPPAFLQQEKKS